MWSLLLLACRPVPVPASVPASVQPPAVRSDALYFALVDRFADARADPPGTVEPGDPQGWHGGDLEGVLAHLDHLDALGVGGLWLSPISAARTEPLDTWGAYHGYWVEELGAIEPRFGDRQVLAALSSALHDRGMVLYLDMVYNHVGYDAPLVEAHPDWFHGLGDIVDWDDPVQRITHDVHGLPDLAQERGEVYAYLLEQTLPWLELASPDGLRIDAVGHLPEGFLRSLRADLRAVSPGVRLLGEVFEGNPAALAARAAADELDEVFDFPLMYAIQDAICGQGPMGRIAAALAVADYGGAAPVTLLDNHDTPRILSVCGGEVERVTTALAWQLSARGTPSVTWGTEVGLSGGAEPDNRADMRWAPDGSAEPHPLGDALRQLLALRGRWPALQRGDTRVLYLSPDQLVVARTEGPGGVLIYGGRTEIASVRWPGSTADERLQPTPAISLQALQAVPARRGGRVRLEVTFAGLPALPEGAIRRAVGASPALGGWDPGAGPPLVNDQLILEVDDGSVLELRLGVAGAGGDFTWESRPSNRILLVTSDEISLNGGAPGCGPDCAPAIDGVARITWE